jgi:hypothetical protein
MGAARSDASVGQLLGMLATDSGTLVRQELRLASTEVVERARVQTGRIGVIALGGGLAHAGLLALLTAAMIGMATFMPLWGAALICGALFAGVGVTLVMKGIKSLKEPIKSAVRDAAAVAGAAVKETTHNVAKVVTAAKDGLR